MSKLESQQKNWRKVKLGDVARVKGGKRLPKGSLVQDDPTSHPYIRVTDMEGDGLTARNIKFITDEIFEIIKKYTISDEDLFISIAGTIGLVGRVPSFLSGANLTENAAKITELSEEVDRDFLIYFLRSARGQDQIRSRISGSSQPKLALFRIADIDIDLPETSIQKGIVGVLSAYDSSIENNTRRIEILEELAQETYREWFVKLKFPGHEKIKHVDSGTEFGKIPVGWDVKELGEVAKNFDSKRRPISKIKRREIQGVFPYYGAAKVIDYVNDYIFDGKYLLMAEDGSVITKSGNPVLQFVNEKFWPNNHTHILQGVLVSTEYLYLYLSQLSISGYITGVAQPKINQGNLNRIPILVPDENVSENFNGYVISVFEEIWNLEAQNHILRQARDLLLPKLVTGEIGV